MRGAKRRTHCKHGHELTDENTYQTYANGSKNGRKCRQCERELQKHYRSNNPDVMCKSRTSHHLRSRYGITIEERDAMLASQDNRCAICGTNECHWGKGFRNTWHVDHPHKGPKRARGILCARCNLLLGQLGDDPEFIQKFIDYLKAVSASDNLSKA